ncbi:MAG: hypothetical protein GF330_04635 [Candidatus Eisenbacteria bacterium]|nr:hypothetical protein [Candidatus Eisenbacteria bacterium]
MHCDHRRRLGPRSPASGGLAYLILALALLLRPPSAEAGVPLAGELLICSPTAEIGPHPGLIAAVDIEREIVRVVSYPAALDETRAVTWGGKKQVYVADGDRILMIDPYGGPLLAPEVFEHPYLRRIRDLVADGAGGVYVLDEVSRPLGDGGRGAVLHFDPASLELTLLSNDFRLGGPVDLFLEAQGTLLVLDPLGKTEAGAERTGAIYRFAPQTGELTTLCPTAFAVDPRAVVSHAPDSLLLVDAEVTVPGFKERTGAVLKLAAGRSEVIDTLAVEEFRNPEAAVLDEQGRLVVLDPSANPAGYQDAEGALFRFDPQSGAFLDEFHHLLFEDLVGLSQMGGAELSQSIVRLEDPDEVPVPGDRLEFEVALINSGVDATEAAVVTADLHQLLCLATDFSYDAGTIDFDAPSGALEWTVAVAPSDTVRLTASVQIPWETVHGTWLRAPVEANWETGQESWSLVMRVVTLARPGDLIYADAGTEAPAPRLFTFDESDPDLPVTFEMESPGELGLPADLTFGPDGMLYVLDGRFGSCGLLRVDPNSGATEVLHRGAPLSHARGLCWSHDGGLLIADPHLPRPFTTGAVYRFDLESGEMTEFFRDEAFSDPTDICPDRYGHYMIVDYGATVGENQGALVEVDGAGGTHWIYSSIYLRDPISVEVVRTGDVFVSDIGFSENPSPWALAKIDRSGAEPAFSAVALANPNPLRRPYGLTALSPTRLHVCERQKSPIAGRTGAVVEFEREGFAWGASFVSFHASLRHPERVAQFRVPEFYCQSLELSDLTGDLLVPGDTLQAVVWLNNRSPLPAPAGQALVQAAFPLNLVSARADRGELLLDRDAGCVQWRGVARFLDPVRVTVTYVVDALARQGEQIEVQAEIPGSGNDPLRAWRRISAPLQGGELLALDSLSDPFEEGHAGALYLFSEEEDRLDPLASHTALVAPSDLWCRASDEALLVDRDADPLLHGNMPGALFAIEPNSGALRVVSAHAAFREPVRVRPHPDGGYLLLDQEAQPCGGEGLGAVYHVATAGGAVDTLICHAALRAPMDLAVDAQRRIWIADAAADPLGLGSEDTGAIFIADLESGAMIDTLAGRDFVSPAAIEILRDGRILIGDLGWTGPFGNLGIREIDPQDGSLTTILNSPYLLTPTRIVQQDAEHLWVVDSTGWFPGYDDASGMVFRLDLQTGDLGVAFPGPSGARLESVSQVPLPELAIRRLSIVGEAAGRYVAPGDTLACELVLANESGTWEPAAYVELEIDATLAPVDDALEASAGSVMPGGEGWRWEGELAGGDSVTIAYALTPRPTPGLPAWGDQRVSGSGYLSAPIEAQRSHHISTRIGPSELLVIDSWADPREFGFATGALFRLEGSTREAAPILADSAFVSPVAVARIPGSQTDLLILDGDAIGLEGIGGGALFRANTWTGEVELLFSDPSFVQPGKLSVLDSTVCFLLDEMADPFDLRPEGGQGPGAIYQIDPRSGAGGVFFSDTLFSRPVDVDVDPLTGNLLVVDKRAGGSGQFAGSVFEIDASGGSATVLHSGEPFYSPRCAALTEGGDLLVADPFPFGGTLFRMDREGNISQETIVCHDLTAPADLVIGSRGRPLIVDAQSDPLRYGPPMGAVLRFFYDGEIPHCSIYRTGPPFVRPRGACIHFEGATPVQQIALEMSETPAGLELRWRAPGALTHADFFVYRRAPEAPDPHYVCLNRDAPVRGAGELRWCDSRIAAGEAYEYLLLAIAGDGLRSEFGPYWVRAVGGGLRFALGPPRPNPCLLSREAGVTIQYQVPAPGGAIRLSVFDVTGRLIDDLVSDPRAPGSYTLLWNACDRAGQRLGAGLYFLRLQAGYREAQRRLLLLR